MRLSQLELFKKIGYSNSLSETANELGVSKSAISHSINDLERELHSSLFYRQGNELLLSRSGETLLPHVEEFQAYLSSAVNAAKEYNNISKNSLSIALMTYISNFPLLVLSFKQNYPELTLNILQQANKFVHEDISSAFDLTIFASEYPLSKNNVTLLFEEDISVAVSASHQLAGKDSLSLKELSNETLMLSPKSSTTFSQILQHYFNRVGLNPSVKFTIDDIGCLKSLIKQGIGVGLLPSRSWIDSNDNNIVTIPLSPPCKRYINIGWHEEYYMTRASRMFLDFIKEHSDDVF